MICYRIYLLLLTCIFHAVLGIDWQQHPNYKSHSIQLPPGKTGFTEVDRKITGILFTNSIPEILAINNQILENGAGIAAGDVDGDGLCDLYFCGAQQNRLFRNLGSWKFQDVTDESLRCPEQFSTGAVFADIDGDGDLDLLVNGLGVGTRSFLNGGQGHFTEDNNSGLQRSGGATSMGMADIDGDGDLDLYVAFYRVSSARNDPVPPQINATRKNGKVLVTPADRFFGLARADGTIEIVEKGEPDILYLNNGKGKFTAVSSTGGVFLDPDGRPLTEPPTDWGLSVMLRDFNGDGFPDLYVCNDFFRSRDQFYLNNGKGQFREISPLAWRSMPLSSMAIDVADINRDGVDDFVVTEMLSRDLRARQYQRANALKPEHNLPLAEIAYQPEVLRNTLQLGRGDGTFADIAWFSGLAASDWSWSCAFLDVDLDGWEDLIVLNGNAHDVLDLDAQKELDTAPPQSSRRGLQFYPRLDQRNLIFRNNHDLTFTESGSSWGFADTGISQGLALADLDNDGDLDLIIGRLNSPAQLYRNDSPEPRISIRCRGKAPNTSAIGARITVLGGPVKQSQVLVAGGRYLSCDQTIRSFATAAAREVDIEVRWPDGKLSKFSKLPANRVYELAESDTASLPTPASPTSPQFEDLSAILNHQHRDEPFDDFASQPLLPWKLSQLGPGLSWFDVDGDGWEDLLIPSGKSGQLAVFKNTKGKFQLLQNDLLSPVITRDQTMLLGVANASGRSVLALASNYEDGLALGTALRSLDLAAGKSTDLIPARNWSFSSVCAADVDGDGDLDLFVAGRTVPGRFAEPASSELWINQGGQFRLDEAARKTLDRIGSVSSAIFSDLDSDGFPELILACEPGSVRILQNTKGAFRDVTTERGLGQMIGLWHGVVAADFDGDGRMDLAVSNVGRNNHLSASVPWTIYFGDLSGAGGMEVIESYQDPLTKRLLPWRDRDAFQRVYPQLQEKALTYRAFAQLDVKELAGAKFSVLQKIEVTTFSSRVFLNRGDRFESRPLPPEAQFAPAFGIVAADFNADGKLDLFLAQNFFEDQLETSRSDAGRGLLLRGNGDGSFTSIPGQESGIISYGSQRGAAACDFDHDGRVDLVLGQNRAAVKLFHNTSATPGLRLRLQGPPGNPEAIGAQVRLRSSRGWGSLQEIRAGSGYFSQDASVCVLTPSAGSIEIEVRWPGGGRTTNAAPPNVNEFVLRAPILTK